MGQISIVTSKDNTKTVKQHTSEIAAASNDQANKFDMENLLANNKLVLHSMDQQIPHHNSPPQQYSPPQKYSPHNTPPKHTSPQDASLQNISPQRTSPTTNPQFHQNLMLWATLQQHQQLQILQAQNMLARASTCFEPQHAGGLLVSTPEKRSRTVFSMTQLEELEKVFRQQQYVVGTERTELAYRLRLTEAQVKVWFQNRRIKHRKQIRGSMASISSDFKIKQENTSPGGSSMSSGISSSASVSPNSLSPLLLAQLMTTSTIQSVVQKPVLVNMNNNIIGNPIGNTIGNTIENTSESKIRGTTSTFIVSTGEDQDVDVEF